MKWLLRNVVWGNVKQSVQCESQCDGGVTSGGERMEVHGPDS